MQITLHVLSHLIKYDLSITDLAIIPVHPTLISPWSVA